MVQEIFGLSAAQAVPTFLTAQWGWWKRAQSVPSMSLVESHWWWDLQIMVVSTCSPWPPPPGGARGVTPKQQRTTDSPVPNPSHTGPSKTLDQSWAPRWAKLAKLPLLHLI